jgi:hypothetical protein
MDLYVNFEGLKYNFKKVWSVFVKFMAPTIFYNY